MARDARIVLQLRNHAAADITAKLAKIAELQRGITLLDKQCQVDAARARLRVYDKTYTVPIPSFEDIDDSLSHDVDDIGANSSTDEKDDERN